MDTNHVSVIRRIEKHSDRLESALSDAYDALLALSSIYNNAAIPAGYGKDDAQIEDMKILTELLGTLRGAFSEHGTTSAQDEIFRETLNVLRAVKHLRKLDELEAL